MNTIKFDAKGVKVIAHRGLSGLERENTNAAFVAAGNRESYFGIETDVHVTDDGVFVIHHDDSLARVMGKALEIEKSSWDDMKHLRAMDKDNLTRSDLCVPTLSEYIRICKKYEKAAVLEIKNEMFPRHLDEIVAIIDTYGMLENTIIISFEWPNCENLRKKYKDLKIQYLRCGWEEGLVEKLVEHNIDLDIGCGGVTKERVDLLHKNGLKVNCWVSNDEQGAERLIKMGIDFITTDILEARI